MNSSKENPNNRTASKHSDIDRQNKIPVTTVASLDSILPDPGQPRRLLPDDLAEAVSKGNLSPLEALQEWLHRVESEMAEPALRHHVRELKRLADSIEQHGLISPISVRSPRLGEITPPGVTYLIVTGERRYWAHVYLLNQGKQIRAGQTTTSPNEIEITIAPPGVSVRAHQLIENLLREDINAVERARGMWALRYELSGVNYSSPSPDLIETEVDTVNLSSFPAPTLPPATEVNYSSPQLAPWSRVEATLGISKRYRIYITSVLNLSEAAQALVAAHNLAEMTIRPITQKLKDKPELQLKALQKVVEWQTGEEEEGLGQSLVASVKELVDQLLIDELTQSGSQVEPSPPKRSRSVSSAPVVRFRDKVRQTLDFLSRLKKTDRVELARALQHGNYADVMIDLRILREQIDAILNTVPQTVEPTMVLPQLTPSTAREAALDESNLSDQEPGDQS